jgi:hypothetical protein
MTRGFSAGPHNKHNADYDEGRWYKESCHKERSENLFDHGMCLRKAQVATCVPRLFGVVRIEQSGRS